eukprot:834757_1
MNVTYSLFHIKMWLDQNEPHGMDCPMLANSHNTKQTQNRRTLTGGFDDADENLLNKYKGLVDDELEDICQEVLGLLQDHLIKNVKGNVDETEVFYFKMCGDYYRYLSEFRKD